VHRIASRRPALIQGAAALLVAVPLLAAPLAAQSIAQRVEAVLKRPEFAHAMAGVAFYDLAEGKAVYRLNGDKFFVPGSTTKLLTVGTALELLGPDYRFHTRIYRTGPIAADGTLDGDLVLVASGDPNLSGRIRPDGTLAFKDEDHSYAGQAVEGDPLLAIRELAGQVAAKGVKRIRGSVVVDASLFQAGDREGGTGVVISPMVVNDNVIDVVVTPAAAPGAAATFTVSPVTSYLRLTVKVATGAADSAAQGRYTSDVAAPDGTRDVTLTGTVPAGGKPQLLPWRVPDPARFAEIVLAEALHERGIVAAARPANAAADLRSLAASYTDQNQVAEHVSPPLAAAAKVVLKVSQNLHAGMLPRIVGAVLAKRTEPQAGFDQEREFLARAGLDLGSASQGDGAGAVAHFTPDFMVGYLAYMAKQKSFPAFYDGLPILGRDGTLFNIQVSSPAAGQVRGKTGTYSQNDLLNQSTMVSGKGLAGYFTRPDGRRFAFAVYLNNVDVKGDDAVRKIVGEAVGEIAAAGYLGR
jgi:D-alanyl-D-alanine carboxypeptidase/D-alanyl-D-alanine-endopeptidase (penicillin-binding protein 4)